MNLTANPKTAQEKEILDLFEKHLAAFNAGDLDAVLSDFGEQSVVITPGGVFEGKDQIRGFYQELIAEFGVIDRGDSPGLIFDVLLLRHNMLFIVWHGESKLRKYQFASDTFICNGGKIERQSICFMFS